MYNYYKHIINLDQIISQCNASWKSFAALYSYYLKKSWKLSCDWNFSRRALFLSILRGGAGRGKEQGRGEKRIKRGKLWCYWWIGSDCLMHFYSWISKCILEILMKINIYNWEVCDDVEYIKIQHTNEL